MFRQEDDLTQLPTDRLEHEVTQLAAHIYAATCRWLLLVAEVERRECHLRWGFHSCTAWLAFTCGLTTRAAREHVRVARDLARLPLIRGAFSRGELSYSKVRALTRAAEPETEGELIALAEDATADQLERTVRAYRGALAAARGETAPTYLVWSWEDDGTLSVNARLPAEEGQRFLKALWHGRDIARGEGDSVPPPVTNVDALAAMSEASLVGEGSSTGGDRYQVVLHADVGALAEGEAAATVTATDEEHRCHLDDGPPVPREAFRRLSCDASVVPMLERAGQPLSVGRKTRTIPPSLRRGLRARDGGCRFPGCTHRRFVEGHHVKHWADGGETSIKNTVQLCRRHHGMVHEGGYTVEPAPGREGEFLFRDPRGHELPAAPPLRRGEAAAISSGKRQLAQPTGEPLDLDLTLEGMFSLWRRVEDGRGEPPGA